MRIGSRWLGAVAVVLAAAGCDGGNVGADALVVGDSPAVCPDLAGTFTSSLVGCDPSITAGDVTVDLDASCGATFTSVAGKTVPPVNGSVQLRGDGSFGPSDLTIGTATLSCTGRPESSGYVIDCGACDVTLRTPG